MHGVCGSVCDNEASLGCKSLLVCLYAPACVTGGILMLLCMPLSLCQQFYVVKVVLYRYFQFIKMWKSSSAVVEVFENPEEVWQLILMSLIML